MSIKQLFYKSSNYKSDKMCVSVFTTLQKEDPHASRMNILYQNLCDDPTPKSPHIKTLFESFASFDSALAERLDKAIENLLLNPIIDDYNYATISSCFDIKTHSLFELEYCLTKWAKDGDFLQKYKKMLPHRPGLKVELIPYIIVSSSNPTLISVILRWFQKSKIVSSRPTVLEQESDPC